MSAYDDGGGYEDFDEAADDTPAPATEGLLSKETGGNPSPPPAKRYRFSSLYIITI